MNKDDIERLLDAGINGHELARILHLISSIASLYDDSAFRLVRDGDLFKLTIDIEFSVDS